MSLDDHQGAAYYVRQLMREAQAEIDRGERKGATVKYKTANPARVSISWFKRRLLLRKRA